MRRDNDNDKYSKSYGNIIEAFIKVGSTETETG